MSHSHTQNFIHCVYSTTKRLHIIPTELLEELWAYNVGIGRNKAIPTVAMGGIENHIHLCIQLPPTVSVADAVSIFKSNSSRWMKMKGVKGFSWQTGHAAFSVSPSKLAAVKSYIRNQREHHKNRTYEEELVELLNLAGIEYDPNNVFD